MSAFDDRDWRARAACRNTEPSLFDSLETHEVKGNRSADPLGHPRIARAVRICGRCPVVAECDTAAEAEGAVGVRGARYRRMPTTPAMGSVERRRRAARKAAAA